MSTFLLEWGESSESESESRRTYFFYVSQTGIETSLSNCPHIKKVWSQPREGDRERIITASYDILKPVTLKMVTMKSMFGTIQYNRAFYIDVGPDEGTLTLVGAEGFGKFEGPGRVDRVKTSKIDRVSLDAHIVKAGPPPVTPKTVATKKARRMIW